MWSDEQVTREGWIKGSSDSRQWRPSDCFVPRIARIDLPPGFVVDRSFVSRCRRLRHLRALDASGAISADFVVLRELRSLKTLVLDDTNVDTEAVLRIVTDGNIENISVVDTLVDYSMLRECGRMASVKRIYVSAKLSKQGYSDVAREECPGIVVVYCGAAP